MATRLSIVVPATDRPPTLDRCVGALRAAAGPDDELIVVTEPAGSSPAAARNAGAARCRGDVIAFVDSDVVVPVGTTSRIRTAFARDPYLVAVFGAYDDSVGLGTVADFRNLLHHLVHRRSAGPVRSFWAGLGAVRRTDFEAVGGFDEQRYPRASIEDIELGARLAGRGVIVLDPTLTGTHLKRWTLRTMVHTDFALRGVPWTRLLLERRSAVGSLNLGRRERLSAAAAVITAWGLVRRRPSAVAAGLAVQCTVNRDLHRLLHRRLGVRGAAAGASLHLVHQWTAVASVPAGAAVHLASVMRPPRGSAARGSPRRAALRARDTTPPR